eukprot:4299502-Ditylum_brightwellii.AAC.1
MEHHGKGLAAFLKAVGFVIPLMEEEYASHYTHLVMPILLWEFHSPDKEMKKIVLKSMAMDWCNHCQIVETMEELANTIGCSNVLETIMDDLKNDSKLHH